MSKKQSPEAAKYQQMVKDRMPKSKTLIKCVNAFWTGGLICCVGQLITDIGRTVFLIPEEHLATYSAIVLVFIGAALTGIGVYDKIGTLAGAGSIVPITGFSNSVVSPAMEFKREGFILGVGAKIFSIAGPVLVYGISASIIVGLLYLIFNG